MWEIPPWGIPGVTVGRLVGDAGADRQRCLPSVLCNGASLPATTRCTRLENHVHRNDDGSGHLEQEPPVRVTRTDASSPDHGRAHAHAGVAARIGRAVELQDVAAALSD